LPAKKSQTGPFPSKADVLRFINDSSEQVGRREIARAFNIRGADRAQLRELLKELADEGAIETGRRRRYGRPGDLPAVAVLEIIEADEDGTLYARPVALPSDEAPPRIVVTGERNRKPALGIGSRLLARLARAGEGYEARVIRRLEAAPDRVFGVYTETAGEGRIMPSDRRQKYEYLVRRNDSMGARRGELVVAEVLPGRRVGLREARIVERFGNADDPRAASLIAIHERDIPDAFSEDALDQARNARPAPIAGRTDLRTLPLVTIDGPDARDFDDAVWAAHDEDPQNPDGWKVVVAIADVAHFVRPGDALDRDARERGNSVYFPDRVVPMLPHELSSDLCSLVPDQDRAVLAVEMIFDKRGHKRRHRFMRAMMRSAARLTYESVQDAHDGRPTELSDGVRNDIVMPLYGAWKALMHARTEREPLDLDLPELQVFLGEDGHVEGVRPRPRYDSHRLIEEFMIAANVCAAETLEKQKQPCMYRVHDEPDREKLSGLKDFLDSIGLSLTLGEVLRPRLFNRILAKAKDGPHWEAVNQSILRAQAQAVYSPDNIGHFGLSLRRYAHFTSPIRRYADLLVHRAMIRGLGLGDGGLSEDEAQRFVEIGEHISNTERRAMAAERDANDRYLAAYMRDHVGGDFEGRINGVTRAGLFVTLADTGADGLVPISTLPGDYYIFDERHRTLTGERSNRRFRLGDRIAVKLAEANPITGGLIFQLKEGATEGDDRRGRGKARSSKRGKSVTKGGKTKGKQRAPRR
jgi:ribonuclease R